MAPSPVPNLPDQHVEDAAFLWLLRDAAATAPHYRLRDLARLDARLDAHLDGLRVAGPDGLAAARQAMADPGEPGEVFTGAVLLFEGGDADAIVEAVAPAAAQPATARAVVAALGWVEPEAAARHAGALLAHPDPACQRIGLAGLATHRREPPPAAVVAALTSEHPPLRARALRSLGEQGRVDLHTTIRAHLKSRDPGCRFWAAWSLARLNGQPDAVAILREFAEAGGPLAPRAATLATRRMPPDDAKFWIRRLVRELGQVRVALASASALADPEVIPFLLDQMNQPAQARRAGEAFALFTGVDIADDGLERAGPMPRPPAGPTEDPADPNVALDPDLNLAWPDPAKARAWWLARAGSFPKGGRYLLGRPIDPGSLALALAEGTQRQRAAAAEELAVLQPNRPWLEVRQPAHCQGGQGS